MTLWQVNNENKNGRKMKVITFFFHISFPFIIKFKNDLNIFQTRIFKSKYILCNILNGTVYLKKIKMKVLITGLNFIQFNYFYKYISFIKLWRII